MYTVLLLKFGRYLCKGSMEMARNSLSSKVKGRRTGYLGSARESCIGFAGHVGRDNTIKKRRKDTSGQSITKTQAGFYGNEAGVFLFFSFYYSFYSLIYIFFCLLL